jgi:uncharacterized protein (DUF2141 family)
LIVGTVVDGETNRPVPGAIVSISASAAAGSAAAAFRALPVAADGEGRFFFRDLPRGRFELSASAPGYLKANPFGARRAGGTSQAIELQDGERLKDITIAMWKPAEISGEITDEAGEPLPNAQVFAMPVLPGSGEARFGQTRGDVTDDRGVFRFIGLPPGRYIVGVASVYTTTPASYVDTGEHAKGSPQEEAVFAQVGRGSNAPPPSEAGFRVGDLLLAPFVGTSAIAVRALDGSFLVSRTTFFPDSATPTGATPIEVAAGETRSDVSLQVNLVPALSISGRLVGPAGPLAHFGLRLMPMGADALPREDGFQAAATVTDSSGAFTFLGVPAGNYVVRATWFPTPINIYTPSLAMQGASGVSYGSASVSVGVSPAGTLGDKVFCASVPVSLGARPIRDVDVVLRGAPRVSGEVKFEGTSPPPSAEQLARFSLVFEAIDVQPAGFHPAPKASVDQSGHFQSDGLAGNRYFLNAGSATPGWFLKSAVWKGKDISDESISLTAEDVSGVVVTFTDRPTGVGGTVRDSRGNADANSDVLVFAADPARRTSARRRALLRVSTSGVYSLSALPAGDYFVVAIDDRVAGEWPDPKFLEVLSRIATRVVLTDGESRTVDLKTVGPLIR